MSAVEVPAELIERTASKLAAMRFSLCGEFHSVPVDQMEACSKGDCPGDLALIAELYALLPQPAPTCPNCGHEDTQHNIFDGCLADAQDMGCGCCITPDALPQVRALLAAERDSKPAPVGPRVWRAGDPEPEGVERVQDREGDIWIKRPSGLWRIEGNTRIGESELNAYGQPKGTAWESLSADFGPLTDQPLAVDR